jgi:fumarate reductase subunit D
MSKIAWIEAVDWLIFSVGGFIAAFLLPIHIIYTNLAGLAPIPGISSYDVLASRLSKIEWQVYFFLIYGGIAWFALHRIRFVLIGVGLVRIRRGVTIASFVALVILLGTIGFAFLAF